MEARATKRPGQKGTRKLVARFGDPPRSLLQNATANFGVGPFPLAGRSRC